ncbi:peptidase, S1/S6 [Desulfosarcina variabilis str. Montpellier]
MKICCHLTIVVLIVSQLLVATGWASQEVDSFEMGMKAQTLMANKQYAQAVDVLTTAVNQDPMSSWLRGMLANSYYQLKKFADAKKQFELIAQMEKGNDLARFMISVLEPLAGLDESAVAAKDKGQRELRPYEIEQTYGSAVLYVLVADENKKVFKTGSGFVITKDGFAVTNHHVVVDGKYIEMRLPNGKQYPVAHVISYDAPRDLAVVQLDTSDPLPVVKMGDSDKVVLGEQAVAIGSPKGMEHTISDGLVSAWRDSGQGFKMIQISVPISHGSSGGPLFNMRGEVIGVTSAGLEDGQNLNFAIPINIVKEVLKKQGKVLLADLPSSKSQGEKPASQTKVTDAELIKDDSGKVACVNRKLGFAFNLTNDAWNMNESIEKEQYFLKCSVSALQVQLNSYAAEKGMTESAMVEVNAKYLLGNGFSQQQAFSETELNGNRAFVGVFDKEIEQDGRTLKVRSPMMLMLKQGQVYFFSLWYLEELESQISPYVTAIQKSFRLSGS